MTAQHPESHLSDYAGILQADAYAGFNGLYEADASPARSLRRRAGAMARRKFFELADLPPRQRKAPPSRRSLEAVSRIDALFDIEREINGLLADRARRGRAGARAPLVAALEDWMRAERAKLSRHAEVAKAIDYMLTRWPAFTRFLDDGRICLTNNAAERALRGIALGRKSWLFAGSDRGGERAAAMYTLIQTAKLNDVDPQAWLADVLARIADHPASAARRAAALELAERSKTSSRPEHRRPVQAGAYCHAAAFTGWIRSICRRQLGRRRNNLGTRRQLFSVEGDAV